MKSLFHKHLRILYKVFGNSKTPHSKNDISSKNPGERKTEKLKNYQQKTYTLTPSNFKQDLLSKSNNRCRHLAVSYTLHLKDNWNLKEEQ